MNLKQIEARFQLVDKKEKYINYYYNPLAKKIPGMKQQVKHLIFYRSTHIKELRRDMLRDQRVLMFTGKIKGLWIGMYEQDRTSKVNDVTKDHKMIKV